MSGDSWPNIAITLKIPSPQYTTTLWGRTDSEHGTSTVSNSTISGNIGGSSGGIFNGGTLTLNNSTVTENSSPDDAGGIGNLGAITINNSTISGNGARWNGGIDTTGATLTIQNSIVANNSGGNCSGTITSDGYNLSDDNTCNFNGPGDMNNTKPKLGKFGNHGGPTLTIPELLGSPTIDAGNPNGCTDGNGHLPTTDQRGYARPGKHKTDQRCDIGAFEKQTD